MLCCWEVINLVLLCLLFLSARKEQKKIKDSGPNNKSTDKIVKGYGIYERTPHVVLVDIGFQ